MRRFAATDMDVSQEQRARWGPCVRWASSQTSLWVESCTVRGEQPCAEHASLVSNVLEEKT